ncbi:MAG TPA: hypothetical protein VMT11_05835 [Myxococcaceae bacterium]|nr:hypothetical protein [Myxococcaceae bacterium]
MSLALLLAVACGGGTPTPPKQPDNVPAPSPVPASIAGPLAGSLSGASASLAAQSSQNALAVQAAALALQAGVQANAVTLTASLVAAPPGRAALTSGSAQAFGFQLVVLNLPGTSSAQTFSGVVVFQGASDWVLVGGPSSGAPIPPGVGTLDAGGQLWTATAGQESAQLLTEGSTCPNTSLPAAVTSCKLATFHNAGFSITSATPYSGGATGSKTASLATTSLGGGVSLIIDCALGALCPGGSSSGGVRVAVTPTPVTLSTNGVQQFAAVVTGTTNSAVTWSVEEAGGGTVSTSGRYTAPSAPGVFHVRATSQQDTSQFGRATVTVSAPATVTVSPSSTTVATLGIVGFTASVSGLSSSAVTWTVDENNGDFAAGKVSASGSYTAPATPGTYHVRARSAVNPGVSGTATVTVTAGCMEALPPIRPATGKTIVLGGWYLPLKLDSRGRLLAAWVEVDATTGVHVAYVSRYEAGTWSVLGSAGVTVNAPFYMDLAIDSLDRPVLAYELFNTTTSGLEIHLARWTAASGWAEFTTPILGSVQNTGFGMALVGDQPAVAVARFLATAPYYDLAVEQWNGSSWAITGGAQLSTTEYMANPTLIVDALGDITVAWDEPFVSGNHSGYAPIARKLSGPGAGPIASPNTGNDVLPGLPSLAFDAAGKLVMGWSNYPDATAGLADGLEVTVYGAPGWTQLGTTLPGLTGVVVPERGVGAWRHPLVLNGNTGHMAAATVTTASNNWAVYEHDATGAWPMVCAPVQDPATGGTASATLATGMTYDGASQAFVLGVVVYDKILVARVRH